MIVMFFSGFAAGAALASASLVLWLYLAERSEE